MRILVLTLIAVAIFFPACHRAPAAKHYPFTGRIISVDTQSHSALIDGDNIPDYMDPMAMSYTVKPATMLSQLSPGDAISADLVVIKAKNEDDEPESWLENIKITGHSTPTPTAATIHTPAAGEDVPDFTFTNQNGKRISLKQYRGKVLVVTFIYTRCPFPDFCPRMTSNFAEVYKQTAANPAIHLLSISFDPDHDTPKVLRDYAFKNAPTHDASLFTRWEFATPTAADLSKIADFFALTVQPEAGQITHTLSTAVIGPDGKIAAWYHGGDWQISDLIKDANAAAPSSK